MNHLGGFGYDKMRLELSVVRGVTRGIFTCGWPPRNKGTKVSPSEDAPRVVKGHMGSVLTE